MKKIITILIMLLFMGCGSSFQRTHVIVNNDMVYGTPKDVEIFPECETHVRNWLVDSGMMCPKDRKINIIFTNNVGSKTNIKVPSGESIIGLYKKDEDRIYCIGYHNKFNLNKFGAEKINIYRGICSHEIAHAYLHSLEYPYTISILQEFICANIEIDLYSLTVKKRILKSVIDIEKKLLLTKDYFLNPKNYVSDFAEYQKLSYYYWNVIFERDIEKFKEFFKEIYEKI